MSVKSLMIQAPGAWQRESKLDWSTFYWYHRAWSPYWRERISTINLLVL